MIIRTLELKDQLNHHRYSWPNTRVNYSLNFTLEEKITENSLVLLNENSEHIPFQLDHVVKETEYILSARICFISNLPLGGAYKFYLCTENKPFFASSSVVPHVEKKESDDFTTITNGRVSLRFKTQFNNQEEQGIFDSFVAICMPDRELKGHLSLVSDKTAESVAFLRLAEGPVYFEYGLKFTFEDKSTYQIKLTLDGLTDFVSIGETVEGFTKDHGAKMFIRWEKFDVTKRYLCPRGYEKIDAFLDHDKEGRLPFVLLPYTNSVGWWSDKIASFTDDQTSLGIFVKDTQLWDDGEYALWGSSQSLAVRFIYARDSIYNEGNLIFEYPIHYGSRTTAIALYDAQLDSKSDLKCYANELWLWHEFLNLDKTKEWILRWEEPQEDYPRYFKEENISQDGAELWWFMLKKDLDPIIVEEYINKLSNSLNNPFEISPVGCREVYSWIIAFDITADKMTQEQFNRLKAAYAFMAYLELDECFMPTEKMLAGHPNFLADVRGGCGGIAALFPNHPHATKWKEGFEKAVARTLKYHVRPDVVLWDAKGGRWTENIGCYTWAALHPYLRANAILKQAFGENVLAYPNLVKWAQWLLSSLSAPIEGSRTFPPQGAHWGGHILDLFVPNFYFRMLGEELMRYQPLLGEYLLHATPADAPGWEERGGKTDLWRSLLQKDLLQNEGTRPMLCSDKYTGYGYVLRDAVNTPLEMSVHLQQIDEGPNYRWGLAGNGGNGVIFYCAQNKRYSYHRLEDVGDDNMGDVQSCCNFGVLIGHEYRSVGRNELRNPLYNFGFAQFAKVDAGPYSAPFYRSRSVLMSGNDYIVIYDEVGDMRVCGRFSWFVKNEEEFPTIVQIKPGAAREEVLPGTPIDRNFSRKGSDSKGVQFNGFGDFLTVVSHRPMNRDYVSYTEKKEYGVKIKLQGRTDYVFRDGGRIRYKDETVSFDGYAGIVRFYHENIAEAALFEGKSIGVNGVTVSISPIEKKEAHTGIGFTLKEDVLTGTFLGEADTEVIVTFRDSDSMEGKRLWIDAIASDAIEISDHTVRFVMKAGQHTWQWSIQKPVPMPTEIIKSIYSSNSAKVSWSPSAGATFYRVQYSKDNGKRWTDYAKEVSECSVILSGFEEEKIHIRVQPCNEDFCGEVSADYPVYFKCSIPFSPEGLKVYNGEKTWTVLWGNILGAEKYCLYRRKQGEEQWHVVYTGEETVYDDLKLRNVNEVFEYAVTAIDGNGESEKSPSRDTKQDGLAFWDPKPEEGFRRYIKSHEYGYSGFNHWANAKKEDLDYPIE